MSYLKINDKDYSAICSELKVSNEVNYNARANAAGDTVVEYINTKRKIEVGFIPLQDAEMLDLQAELSKFSVSLTFRNPRTNDVEVISCIVAKNGVEYYTIQSNNVSYKAFTAIFTEL